MADAYMVEPDVDFIKKIGESGGEDLKKCFQCATCSVACAISPDKKPFPRKEMISASWGLKDKLVSNGDIWLCHNCGDCTTLCTRGAKPGDVLAAIRSYAVSEYSRPKLVADAVNDPKKLPFLLAVPVILFIVVGLITGLLDFTPGGDEVVHAKFFSTWLVDIMMLSAATWTVIIFALGIKRFLNDIHENAVLEGKTDKKDINPKDFILGLIRTIPTILIHNKFSDCEENKDRETAHLLVFYSFISLFIVTNIFFFHLYILQWHGPYSQLHPVKWLANLAGTALIIGSILMIKNRLSKTDQVSTYKDWFLLALALALGLTGMLSEITRLLNLAGVSYTIYFIHLVFVFTLFAYVPFTKLAHLVYRTIAMAYAEYSERNF